MSLAELFGIKETFRQRIRARRQQKLTKPTSRMLFESLESRLLLSATPAEVIAPQEAPVTQAEVTPSADPVLTIGDVTVVEGNGTFGPAMQFGVTLSQAAATNVAVTYQTISGTAKEGEDFSQTVGTLTIAAGQSSGTITVSPFGGTVIESDEYFVVELTNPQGVAFVDGAPRARAFGVIFGR